MTNSSFSESELEELAEALGINEIAEKVFFVKPNDDRDTNEDEDEDISEIDAENLDPDEMVYTSSPDEENTDGGDITTFSDAQLRTPWPVIVLDGNQVGTPISSISAGVTGGTGLYNRTVTTSTTHTFNDGDTVYIKNVNPADFAERVIVKQANPTDKTFTYDTRISNSLSYASGGDAALDLTIRRVADDGSVYVDIVIEFDQVDDLSRSENYQLRPPYPNN